VKTQNVTGQIRPIVGTKSVTRPDKGRVKRLEDTGEVIKAISGGIRGEIRRQQECYEPS